MRERLVDERFAGLRFVGGPAARGEGQLEDIEGRSIQDQQLGIELHARRKRHADFPHASSRPLGDTAIPVRRSLPSVARASLVTISLS